MNFLRRFIDDYGYTCDLCGAEVFDYPTHRFCAECEESLFYNDEKLCGKCGRKTVAEGICVACKSRLPKFSKGFSALVYRGETASIVNRMKNGKRRFCLCLGEKLADAFLKLHPTISGEVSVVFVPLSPKRKEERGYDQAELLAKSVAKRLNARGVTAVLDGALLCKREETSAQKKLKISERERNAKEAYFLRARKPCRDRTFLLVDDIMTTGATGSACADLLNRAGARAVYFLTVASSPEERSKNGDIQI